MVAVTHGHPVYHVNFSDHSCVQLSLDLPNVPKAGKFYWKMNDCIRCWRSITYKKYSLIKYLKNLNFKII